MTSPETAFIAALRGIATTPAARALADDCAVLELGGEALVLTHDMMAEGIHWLPGQDPADVAWKLVASNLSDLAAKGAAPLGVLLGYSLGDGQDRFVAGLHAALNAFATPLLGGDTIATPGAQVHGLTALGRATHQPVPSRGGARDGDGVWITGHVGAAMLGFEALRDGGAQMQSSADVTDHFRRPVPRISDGIALAPFVTAMMDISDGLLLDASRMGLASGVTLAIESAAVPLAPGVAEHRRMNALAWGEDYELLFTLPADATPPVPATRVGTAQAKGPHPVLLDGTPPPGPLGYEHGGNGG